MTEWEWWAGHPDEDSYDIAQAATRDAVIAAAMRELGQGDTFQIIEARSSTAAEHEGSDFVPFLRTRNHEIITVGPRS